MLNELLPMVPIDAGKLGIGIGIGATAVGLVLWIAGARFSRGMLTLLLVSIGAYFGKKLPEWYGWSFSPAAFAVGAAVACGVAGFALHRLWVGITLGLITAFWAGISTWMLRHGQSAWSWPSLSADMTLADFARQLWEILPEGVREMLPYSAGTAMVSGVVLALIKPRLATVLTWSIIGTSLMLLGTIVATQLYQPAWFAKAPAELWAQLLIVASVVAFGAVVQWKLAPPGRVKLPKVQNSTD